MSTSKRYPTDLTDRQWALVEPLLPSDPPRGPGGRPPEHSKREIVNAILYQVRAGGAWRMLPRDLPPWQTVYGYFRDWRADGTLDRLHDALREEVRTEQEQRNPEPSAGIVDSQSVKGADTVSASTRGYDAGKKVNGRKRHIVVDTIGLLLVVIVTSASVQDRDGGRGILKLLHGALGSVRHVFADGGYRGQLVAVAKSAWGIAVEVVRKPPDQRGFAVLPRRWVVERTFSWLMRQRRLARDYERLPATHEAIVKWAMVAVMLNRLAPPPGPRPWSSKKARK
ncbi:MAG: IS5 family transposase [Actinobacteria bacterium]|nr:IS5 family transposase [Actinomycetota bacterium]